MANIPSLLGRRKEMQKKVNLKLIFWVDEYISLLKYKTWNLIHSLMPSRCVWNPEDKTSPIWF